MDSALIKAIGLKALLVGVSALLIFGSLMQLNLSLVLEASILLLKSFLIKLQPVESMVPTDLRRKLIRHM